MHPLEVKTINALKKGAKTIEEISKLANLNEDQVRKALFWLKTKEIVKENKIKKYLIKLSEFGKKYLKEDLPEIKVLKLNGKPLREFGEEEKVGFGFAKKLGWITVENGKLKVLKKPKEYGLQKLIKDLEKEKIVNDLDSFLKKYNLNKKKIKERARLFEIEEKFEYSYELIKKVDVKEGEGIGALTPEIISSGEWKGKKFRKFDIHSPSPKIYPGKKQFYRYFLDWVKRELISMGFQEMRGPLIETNFVNCDALFMPQDHPSREIHDIYFIKEPKYGDLKEFEKYVEKVKESHEKYWKYKFDLNLTKRLILRSQVTALSARWLMGKVEIPGKYFAIGRVFRPDVVDWKHLTEFNQIEGIVLDENINLRNLLGMLKMFAEKIAGAKKVRFDSGYFPFTEPSVEMSVYIEGKGWTEVGGAGIFRPEMTKALGIDVPVIAWGLGIDRLFMIKYGLKDIRYLFSQDLNWLRDAKCLP